MWAVSEINSGSHAVLHIAIGNACYSVLKHVSWILWRAGICYVHDLAALAGAEHLLMVGKAVQTGLTLAGAPTSELYTCLLQPMVLQEL